MKFDWALSQLLLGKKVRCKSWDNPNSYIYEKNGLIFSHKNTKAYFFIDSFMDEDWEIYELIVPLKDEKFFCGNCKKEVKFGNKFCGNCGAPQLWALFG